MNHLLLCMGITESTLWARNDWDCRKCHMKIYGTKDRCLKCKTHRRDWNCSRCKVWLFYPKTTCFTCSMKVDDWYCVKCDLNMTPNEKGQCIGCNKFMSPDYELKYIKENGTPVESEQFMELHPGLQPCKHSTTRDSCYKCS